MIGDTDDMAHRLRSLLPKRWFGDQTPVLDLLLYGFSSAFAYIFEFIQFTQHQARLATATGQYLDLIASDFFGSSVSRRTWDSDQSYRLRISQLLLQRRGTRDALSIALTNLTGFSPSIFEPSNVLDTGSYNTGGCAYCVVGGYGSLGLPGQAFVTARRPIGWGIAELAGYATGGPLAYGSLLMTEPIIRDGDILSTISDQAPAGAILWVRITS